MRKLLCIFPLSLIAIILVCCGRDAAMDRELSRLERIVDEHPDSVLRALERMEIDTLSPGPLRARHALLISWAMYKDYLDPACDSIINIAVAHYSRTSDRKNLAKAYFLRGIIYLSQGRTYESMTDNLRAVEALDGIDDPLLRGKIYQIISECLSRVYAVNESLDFARKALHEFESYGDSAYIEYHKIFLGMDYMLASDYEKGANFAKDAIVFAKAQSDDRLLSDGLRLLAVCEYGLDSIDSAYGHYIELESMPHRPLSHEESNIFATLCLKSGDEVRSDSLQAEMEVDVPDAMKPVDVYVSQGRYKEAFEIVNAQADSMDAVLNVMINQNATMMLRDYEENRSRMAVEREESRKIFSIILLICVVIISGLIVSLLVKTISAHREKERTLRLEKDYFIIKVENLSRELRDASSRAMAAERAVAELEQERQNNGYKRILTSTYQLLDGLCKSYYDNSLKRSGEDSPIEAIDLVDKFRIGGEYLASLEKNINLITSDAITKLRGAGLRLTEEDYQLMMLSIVGVSLVSISVIMKLKKDVLYNRRSRLKKKISELDTDYAAQLVELM